MASNPSIDQTPSSTRPVAKVLVATTAMLTFISFWRAAAIVLNDLASSAYYAGGEAEGFIGTTAPWFVLAPVPTCVDTAHPLRYGSIEAGALLDRVLYDIGLIRPDPD